MKKKLSQNKNAQNFIIIFSFLIISVLSISIIFINHSISNISDAQFHLKRISEIIEDFHHGNILPEYSFNQFNGSIIMSLYPYINLLPIVLLSNVIKSKILLLCVNFGLNVFIGLLISYYGSKSYSKNICTSYLFSVIYMLSTIFIGYNFRLFDLGSSSAYVFAPLVIFGFLKLIKNNYYLELSLGITLMGFSHIPDTVIFIVFLIICLILNINDIHFYTIITFIKSLILSLLLLSIFWIPFIQALLNNNHMLHFTGTVVPVNIPISDFIKSALCDDSIMGLGTFVTAIIFIFPLFYKYSNKDIKFMYLISLIIIFICIIIKWKYMPSVVISIMKHFQFMYRFLLIPIILLSYVCSYIVTKRYNNKLLFYLFILLAIIFQLIGQGYYVHRFINGNIHVINKEYLLNYRMNNTKGVNLVINKRPNGTDSDGNVTKGSSGADYYPKATFSRLNYINNNKAFFGKHCINVKRVGYNTFLFKNKHHLKSLNLPLIKYNKEKIHLYLNKKTITLHINKYSTIRINNIHRGTHIITIKSYPNDYLLYAEYILSIIGIIWILLLYLRNKNNLII